LVVELVKMDTETINKIKQQQLYCEKNSVPMFAPVTDKSWCCNRNIWAEITTERASSELITSCPICHRSFVD
jgi:hypothetical protein